MRYQYLSLKTRSLENNITIVFQSLNNGQFPIRIYAFDHPRTKKLDATKFTQADDQLFSCPKPLSVYSNPNTGFDILLLLTDEPLYLLNSLLNKDIAIHRPISYHSL